MTTTRRRLTTIGFSLLLGAGAIAGCSSGNKSDNAADTTTTTVAETTTTAASASTASGTASCTEEDMAKAAEPTHAGAVVTEITCNSLDSRAAATVKDKGECAKGCVGFFVADNGSWKLVGVQPAGDPIDAATYSDWNTLHISWNNKFQAVTNPPKKPSGSSGVVAGSGAGSSNGVPADGSEPTVPTIPKSSFCTYYGPVPACVQDPTYMPPTIPPTTVAPPEVPPAP